VEPLLKADVNVRYRRALLPYWREIQDGVTKVLLDFRVDPSKETSAQPKPSSTSSLTQK
jgi:hypothetical protein